MTFDHRHCGRFDRCCTCGEPAPSYAPHWTPKIDHIHLCPRCDLPFACTRGPYDRISLTDCALSWCMDCVDRWNRNLAKKVRAARLNGEPMKSPPWMTWRPWTRR